MIDLRGPRRSDLRNQAITIDSSDIEKYAGRTVLLQTVFDLRNANAREIAASLRPFFPDNNIETIANIGHSQRLLTFGFPATLQKMSEMIRKADGHATPAQEQGELERLVASLRQRVAALEREIDAMRKAAAEKK